MRRAGLFAIAAAIVALAFVPVFVLTVNLVIPRVAMAILDAPGVESPRLVIRVLSRVRCVSRCRDECGRGIDRCRLSPWH